MLVDVANKTIVITGSSRGIGKELARIFAKEQANVVINYCKSEKDAEILFHEIRGYGCKCLKVKADIRNPRDVSNFYKETIDTFGRVDVLINNAGICDDNLIQMMTLEQWNQVVDVNLTGTYLCSREFSKIMIKQKYGKIINISSLKGQEGCRGQVNYSASKAAIIGFTKTLAKEVGNYNISVNAVCPGFILTDLNRHNIEKQLIAKERSLLDVSTSLDDLVNFIVYMSSDLLKGVSGRVFNLDSRLL